MTSRRCEVWGVLNVTPDSFSDGGKFSHIDSALSHAMVMHRAGADVIDVGGESTRPGATRVSEFEELQRVLPVIAALSQQGIRTSIDTMRADVARRCVEAGAAIVNDVSGGNSDPAMYRTVAGLGCDFVLMHWRGHSDVMDSRADYHAVASEVIDEWNRSRDAAVAAGVASERIIFDPGLGFAKDAHHNWQLLREVSKLSEVAERMLIGASRKRFLADCVATDAQAGAADRDAATAALSFYRAVAFGIRGPCPRCRRFCGRDQDRLGFRGIP